MNFKIFLNGKSKEQIMDIAEIWYARLNYLKGEKHIFVQSKKREAIMIELICRLMYLSQIIIRNSQPKPPKDFKEGGFIYGRINNLFIEGEGKIIPLNNFSFTTRFQDTEGVNTNKEFYESFEADNAVDDLLKEVKINKSQ